MPYVHADPALLMHSTVCACTMLTSNYIAATPAQHNSQHNALSMHINMHYRPSTTHPTAFVSKKAQDVGVTKCRVYGLDYYCVS